MASHGTAYKRKQLMSLLGVATEGSGSAKKAEQPPFGTLMFTCSGRGTGEPLTAHVLFLGWNRGVRVVREDTRLTVQVSCKNELSERVVGKKTCDILRKESVY